MTFESADDLKTLIIQTAQEYKNQELFALLMNLVRLSSFEMIAFDPKKPETAQGTAYIKRLGLNRYQVKFYEKFVNTYLKTGDDCVFVLLHELSHWQQGDLIRPSSQHSSSLNPIYSNIVADMLINARLCQNWFPQGVPFFERFYSDQDEHGQSQPLRLFGHFLMPPQIFFTLYKDVIQSQLSRLNLDLPLSFDYRLYSVEQYSSYRTLLTHVLSDLYSECTPMCIRETASIYCLAWLGRTSFRPLYRRISALIDGRFEGCLGCIDCDQESPKPTLDQDLIDELNEYADLLIDSSSSSKESTSSPSICPLSDC